MSHCDEAELLHAAASNHSGIGRITFKSPGINCGKLLRFELKRLLAEKTMTTAILDHDTEALRI
jgi:hypothetical protein